MDIKQLRSLIRHTVRSQINESLGNLTAPPKNLNEFRRVLAAALAGAGAPQDLVEEVGEMHMEGGGVFGALWGAWQNIESELKGLKGRDLKEAWIECIEFYVHDAVIDMVDEWKNPMNYEPGRKVGRIDDVKLAADVVSTMKDLARSL